MTDSVSFLPTERSVTSPVAALGSQWVLCLVQLRKKPGGNRTHLHDKTSPSCGVSYSGGLHQLSREGALRGHHRSLV